MGLALCLCQEGSCMQVLPESPPPAPSTPRQPLEAAHANGTCLEATASTAHGAPSAAAQPPEQPAEQHGLQAAERSNSQGDPPQAHQVAVCVEEELQRILHAGQAFAQAQGDVQAAAPSQEAIR